MKKVKRTGLFKESLEGISRNVFRNHSGIITKLIGNSSGVYALYDENDLYYVGKASALRQRVNQHLKDRHNSQWTHFSLFLIRRVNFINDIEALLIRIAEPVGNRVKPKKKDSKILLRKLRALIKRQQKEELRELLSGKIHKTIEKKGHQQGDLKGLVKYRKAMYSTYKGKEYKAVLTPAGHIIYKRNSYKSATAAAKAIVKGKPVNGWHFWRIRNSSGEWVRLRDY